MSNKAKKPRYRLRLFFLYIGSFIASVAPLAVYFFFNGYKYIAEPSAAVKLCFGGAIALVLVFLKILGKLKMPQDTVTVGIVFVLSYLLQPILRDLTVLCGMYLLGSFLDLIFFKHPIKRTRENILIARNAGATADAVEAVLKNMGGKE